MANKRGGSIAIDLTGQVFGKLTVQCRGPNRGQNAYWVCLCKCGVTTTVRGSSLRAGDSTSCGCNRALSSTMVQSVHKAVGTPEYYSWAGMKRRCSNPNDPSYPNYGGRGISVALEWQVSFPAFLEHIGPKPAPGMSVDRIDNSGNYEPGNVRWATAKQQAENRRPPRKRKQPGTMAIEVR